jgi:hypothetical protein
MKQIKKKEEIISRLEFQSKKKDSATHKTKFVQEL